MRPLVPFTLALALGLPAAAGVARAQSREDVASVNTLLVSTPRLTAWLRARSAGVRAASERLLQAQADVRQAGVFPNPTLGLEFGTVPLGETNPPGLGVSDTAHVTVGVQETVELGKRGPRIHGAELRAQAAAEDGVGTLADRLGDARLALARVVLAHAKLASLDENLRAASELTTLETARRKAGDISESDLQRVILDAQAVELEVAHGRADLADALASCRAVLEVPCSDEGVSADSLDTAAEVPSDLPDPAQAVAARADLRALDLQRRGALEDATLAHHRIIPDPQLGVSYTRDWLTIAGNQPGSVTFNLGIPLNFFDTGAHDAAKAEAHARELEATAHGARLEAESAAAGLIDKRKTLEAASSKLRSDTLPRSQAVLESTRKAYETGHVGLSDLILVQRNHRELVGKALDLRFELFQARNDLRRALGLDAEAARQPREAQEERQP
jgi:cobalt-zinc-cadmium efflux system outer membrane protein